MAKAERDSLIRRKEAEDRWRSTLWVECPSGVCLRAPCLPITACTCEFVHLTDVCVCVCVARHGRWCQYEFAGLAVGRHNNRLQQVGGGHLTLLNTLAELPADARSDGPDTHRQWSEGNQHWSVVVLLHFLLSWMFSFYTWIFLCYSRENISSCFHPKLTRLTFTASKSSHWCWCSNLSDFSKVR